ncbi:hypothetical protein M0R45_030890 [Rubus argutus]|uniref:Uncharacterized protein n=1 Tax=Rubus argutus TaxID=59490 RepID=A0AAW1WCP2_RUBAR
MRAWQAGSDREIKLKTVVVWAHGDRSQAWQWLGIKVIEGYELKAGHGGDSVNCPLFTSQSSPGSPLNCNPISSAHSTTVSSLYTQSTPCFLNRVSQPKLSIPSRPALSPPATKLHSLQIAATCNSNIQVTIAAGMNHHYHRLKPNHGLQSLSHDHHNHLCRDSSPHHHETSDSTATFHNCRRFNTQTLASSLGTQTRPKPLALSPCSPKASNSSTMVSLQSQLSFITSQQPQIIPGQEAQPKATAMAVVALSIAQVIFHHFNPQTP